MHRIQPLFDNNKRIKILKYDIISFSRNGIGWDYHGLNLKMNSSWQK